MNQEQRKKVTTQKNSILINAFIDAAKEEPKQMGEGVIILMDQNRSFEKSTEVLVCYL